MVQQQKERTLAEVGSQQSGSTSLFGEEHVMGMEGGPLFAALFASFPDALILCDQEGNILQLNAAALALFEEPSEHFWRAKPCQQFFQSYRQNDDLPLPLLSPSGFPYLLLEGGAVAPSTTPVLLQMPSGHQILVQQRWALLRDEQQQIVGMLFLLQDMTQSLHRTQHLQRVREAILALTEAIARMPEHFENGSWEGSLLLSPPVMFVAQPLVDVIHQVLSCRRVTLIALEPPTDQFSYVVGSGLTPEQEQRRQELSGLFQLADFVDETVRGRLHTNHEVVLSMDRLHVPSDFPWDLLSATLLVLPLFLEQRLAGLLVIYKLGNAQSYLPEEIELVKVVAAQALLIIECLGCLQKQESVRARSLVQHEVHRLSTDFLMLASHELRTPLTGIKGNLQLAQRRLETLKRQFPAQTQPPLERIQQPLASLAESVRLQEHMIRDMIDYARIQTKTLNLSFQRCDLLVLVRGVLATQHQAAPERTLVLDVRSTAPVIPILADAQRISQVITTYVANALAYAPTEAPVTVQVLLEDSLARVEVNGDGPGMTEEDQAHLWDRFYRARGNAVQHELDLSLGLSFYLCRVLMELHRGQVGVKSVPGHGTTFWLTIPLALS